MGRMTVLLLLAGLLNCGKLAAQLRLTPVVDTSVKKPVIKVLPQNFYSHKLGYFCKKELQLQQATRLPIFIRLGSKDYVDYLERKPNSAAGGRRF